MNVLLGEPVYDDNGKIVGRDLGIKNAVFILIIGCIGYSLISGYTVKSGKKKMKGGEFVGFQDWGGGGGLFGFDFEDLIVLSGWFTRGICALFFALSSILYVFFVLFSRLGWPKFLKGNKWYQNKDWDSKKFSDNLKTGGIYLGVVVGSVVSLFLLYFIKLIVADHRLPLAVIPVAYVVGHALYESIRLTLKAI